MMNWNLLWLSLYWKPRIARYQLPAKCPNFSKLEKDQIREALLHWAQYLRHMEKARTSLRT